jgi:PAS domain S-box-containing protein
MPYQAPSHPRPTGGKETRLSSGIATNGPMVQREELESESAETKVAFERAERLANLLSLSYEAMFAWQWDGPIEFWNAGAERLYGFSPSEAVGRSSHTLLQTKFPVEFSELRSQLLNERYWSGELRHICKDGDEVTVDSRMQLLGDDTVLEANRDVTQIKALNIRQSILMRELRESELRLRSLASIVESSDDAIVSKNLDGIITSWNRGAERIFGYTAEEAVGQPITMVIPQDRQNEERAILTRIRRGERIDHFETVRQRKHGSLIVVSLTVSPVKDDEGKIVGASKIARDITEQKRSQEQIATLAREAEHRSKNLLATVQATVNLSRSDTPEGLKQAIEGRIMALANVHSLFVETRWIGAELSAIATRELAPYSETDERRVRIDGPQVLLEPTAAQAIAMTLHELATNAAKCGALSAPNGQIDLKWLHEADGRLILCWREMGGPAVQMPTHRGFGTRVIESVIGQLKGKAHFDWRAEGLVCEITLQT